MRWERDRLKRVLCFLGLTADALVSTGLAKLGYIYVNIGMYYVAIDLRRFSFRHKSNFSFSKVGTRNWARTSISDFPRWLLGWNASWCQGLVSLTIFAKLVSLTILVVALNIWFYFFRVIYCLRIQHFHLALKPLQITFTARA